jgi:hypothetical protein
MLSWLKIIVSDTQKCYLNEQILLVKITFLSDYLLVKITSLTDFTSNLQTIESITFENHSLDVQSSWKILQSFSEY